MGDFEGLEKYLTELNNSNLVTRQAGTVKENHSGNDALQEFHEEWDRIQKERKKK